MIWIVIYYAINIYWFFLIHMKMFLQYYIWKGLKNMWILLVFNYTWLHQFWNNIKKYLLKLLTLWESHWYIGFRNMTVVWLWSEPY